MKRKRIQETETKISFDFKSMELSSCPSAINATLRDEVVRCVGRIMYLSVYINLCLPPFA